MLHPYAVQSSYFHVFKFAINAIIYPEILEFFQIKNIFSVFNDLKRLFYTNLPICIKKNTI